MAGSRRHEKLVASGAAMALVAVLVPWSASCATTDAETAPPDEASTLPGQDGSATDAGAIGDGDADGGCDAADDNCVTRPVTCAEAPWCPVPTTVASTYALTAVWGSAKNDVWAVGSGGTIIHYDGTAWTPTPTNLKHTFQAVWGSSATDVWAVATSDVILRSNGFAANGATSWKRVTPAVEDGQGRPVFALWGPPGGDVRMGGYSFGLEIPPDIFTSGNQFASRKLADGGVAWTGIEGAATIKGMWGSSADDVWIVADNSDRVSWQLGYTAHGTRATGGGDAGARDLTWKQVDSQASVVLDAVWGSSAGDVWAVGDKGTIRHITAGQPQWQIVASPTTDALHAIWGSSANDAWAVGDFGTILHFDGTKWSESSAAFPVNKKRPHLHGVWGSGPDDVWIVGEGIGLHYTGPKAAAGGGGQ
jgi:hypothetical protein